MPSTSTTKRVVVIGFVEIVMTAPLRGSALHAPFVDCVHLDVAEEDIFDQQPDDDDHEQGGKHVSRLQILAFLVDHPTETAGTGQGAEDQLSADQGAPGEGPSDLEADQDRGEPRWHENLKDIGNAAQSVVPPDHAQGFADSHKPDMGAERNRPENGVNGDEHQARRAQPEPQHGERQKRDRRQRLEHRCEGA